MHDVRGPHGSKMTEPGFSGNISLCPNQPKTVQNGLKIHLFNIISKRRKPIYQEKLGLKLIF